MVFKHVATCQSTGEVKDDIAKSMEKLQIDQSSSGTTNFKRKPVIIIVVGMAGIMLLEPSTTILDICPIFSVQSTFLVFGSDLFVN